MTARNIIKSIKNQKGFTLIELLVVIGILAILLAITLIAINPARQFAQANNTKRNSDINAILNAIGQYAADNHGTLPPSGNGTDFTAANCPSTAPCHLAGAASAGGGAANTVDLCGALVTSYLAAYPVDPLVNNGTPVSTCDNAYTTGYEV
ncbi:MAG TPA: type II secretion system protein, partial [Patescibacteria group bacterium]